MKNFTELAKGDKVWEIQTDPDRCKINLTKHTVSEVHMPQTTPYATVQVRFEKGTRKKECGFATDYRNLLKNQLVTYSSYYFTDENEAKTKYAELWESCIKESGLKVRKASDEYQKWLKNWRKSGMPV